MRVAILSPYSRGPSRGNVTTVRRIATALRSEGADVAVFPVDVFGPAAVEEDVSAFRPDVVHGFHATVCGGAACRLARRSGVPSVITTTGSDLCDIRMRSAPETALTLAEADSIVCFTPTAAAGIARFFPFAAGKTVTIPQGVERLSAGGGLPVEIPGEAFVVLLPAALRPVKNVAFPVTALSSVAPAKGNLLLLLAGGIIDHEYAGEIMRLLETAPFARAIGEVPYEQMGDLYLRADLVLNSSLYEGMSNSLLEAMALGRPVLASDVAGNRSIIRHGDTGWLYRDHGDFIALFTEIVGDAALRSAVGKRAGAAVEHSFSVAQEALSYLALYADLAKRG